MKDTASKTQFLSNTKNYMKVLDTLADGYYVIDKNWRYTYVNHKGCELAQKTHEEIVGKKVTELFPDAHKLPFGETAKKVMKDRKKRTVEAFFPRYNKWYEDTCYALDDGSIAIVARDVTDRKNTEGNLRFLAKASKALSSSLDYQTTLNTVASLAISQIADWCAIDIIAENNNVQQLAIAHKDPKKVTWAKELRRQQPIDLKTTTSIAKVLRTGKSEIYPSITDAMLVAGAKNKKELALLRSLKLTSVIIVPIVSRHKPIGTISLITTDESRIYTQADLSMAEELASRASLAIENARLYTDVQRELAQRTQSEESNARFAALLDQTFDAVLLWKLNGTTITYWNKGAEELYGYTKKEALGQSVHKFLKTVHPIPFQQIQKILFKEGRWEGQLIHTTKDDIARIVSCKKMLITEKDGTQYVLETNRDMTERINYEREIQMNEERLRLALEAGHIGVWEWDVQKNIIFWSDRLYEFYGVTPDNFQVTFEIFMHHIHTEDRKRIQHAIKKALDGTKQYAVIHRIITPQGETKWITSRAIVIRDPQGKPLRMLGATSDVTEQKKLEQDKNDFVSIATHELKTPVTSLKAYTEVLQKRFGKSGDIASATQMGKMNAQLDKLTSLISDLLDATKIEAGKLQMHEETFDFDDLVKEIAEELQRTTEKHTLVIEGLTNKTIYADRERTGQVLTNLISNAIKYSPHTEKIVILPSVTAKAVQLCVKDFGVGIPKIKQKHIFERFYRVSGPKENTFPGLGLGLYISSEIIKRQGGKIWVESELGKGSTFCFSLPIKKIRQTKN